MLPIEWRVVEPTRFDDRHRGETRTATITHELADMPGKQTRNRSPFEKRLEFIVEWGS
jgi:hypothetical protein